jgi:PPOX class probable F420-dependent enzyme
VLLEDPGIDRLLDTWPVARLASVGPDGAPHLVPVVFARTGGVLWSPIDGKPKAGRPLARLRNVEREPRVALLLDHYDDDWQRLWWIRIDARAQAVAGDAGAEAALRAKYPQYETMPLYAGEPLLLRIDPLRVASWRAAP